jgi:hypothetical protein
MLTRGKPAQKTERSRTTNVACAELGSGADRKHEGLFSVEANL